MSIEYKLREFPEIPQNRVFQAFEAYEAIIPSLTRPRQEVYIGGPVTSGGARRLFGPIVTADDMVHIKYLNKCIAFQTISHIADLFPDDIITLPHNVDFGDTATEAEINKFWLLYLTGIQADFAKQFCDLTSELSLLSMDFHNLPRSARHQICMSHQEMFFQLLTIAIGDDQYNPAVLTNPVSAMVFLFDHGVSLGSRLEVNIARRMGIPRYTIVVDSSFLSQNIGLLATLGLQDILTKGEMIDGEPFYMPTVVSDGSRLIHLVPLE